MNYWPGFVDALSTFILGIMFLLTVFVLLSADDFEDAAHAGVDPAIEGVNAVPVRREGPGHAALRPLRVIRPAATDL